MSEQGYYASPAELAKLRSRVAELEAECIAANAEIELQLQWFEQQRIAA
jgi:hypothetical protein